MLDLMLIRSVRRFVRTLVDSCLKPLNLRIVNRDRVPRGVFEALRRIKNYPLIVEKVIDVGAANGNWTRECLKLFPHARYQLIECLDSHSHCLASLTAKHRNVSYQICAVGESHSEVLLYEHGNQTSVLQSEYVQSPNTTASKVELRTLDSLVHPNCLTGTTLLKLDVQGYEIDVLQGSPQLLAKNELELILAEVSFRRIYHEAPLAHEVIRFLSERGFRIFDICSYCPRPHDLELAQCDLLFARSDSSLFAYEGWN